MKLCECGCGREVAKEGNRFVRGHNRTGTTPCSETIKKMQISQSERQAHTVMDKETRDKISFGLRLVHKNDPSLAEHLSKVQTAVWDGDNDRKTKLSDRMKKHYADMEIPGNEMVGHHMIYDHNNLTKNVMPMTRSMHTRLHNLFRNNGIEIPHINV